MIFVIAAIFILVVSFVIALVSLMREQSKIEKASADASLAADQINVHQPQVVEKKALGPQPQPPPQIQAQTQREDLSAMHLAQKPWWEKEIQKREKEPQGSTIDWQDTSQVHKPPDADVSKIEELGEVLEPQGSFSVQTTQGKDQNLHGSFSLSDLKGTDQES